MLPSRFLQPWEVLEIDFQDMHRTSASGNRYILLIVDRASKFLFAFPTPTKEAAPVSRIMLNLCLTFGIPKAIRSDKGGEFAATVVSDLCRWLRVSLDYGPTDHPRGQGAVERVGAWMHDTLSELCKSWPERWDEYVDPACWIKRTLPDPSTPFNMSPFEILFGRTPRTTIDTYRTPPDDE